MLASPRCGARTRCGQPCRAPAVRGKHRCRMHGGAHGSGAPRGNRNAVKHGLFTGDALARRRRVNRILRDGARLLRRIGTGSGDPAGPPDQPRRRQTHPPRRAKPSTGPPGVRCSIIVGPSRRP